MNLPLFSPLSKREEWQVEISTIVFFTFSEKLQVYQVNPIHAKKLKLILPQCAYWFNMQLNSVTVSMFILLTDGQNLLSASICRLSSFSLEYECFHSSAITDLQYEAHFLNIIFLSAFHFNSSISFLIKIIVSQNLSNSSLIRFLLVKASSTCNRK